MPIHKRMLFWTMSVAVLVVSLFWKIPFVIGWGLFHPEEIGKGRVAVHTPFPWMRLQGERTVVFEAFRSMVPFTGGATSSVHLDIESEADTAESDTAWVDGYVKRFAEVGETATVTRPRSDVLCVRAEHGDIELHCRSEWKVMLVYRGDSRQADSALETLRRARLQ